jgi:hypothetical protein
VTAEARSIFDIEFNDSAFTEFQKKFADFKAALDTIPDAWAKVGEKIGGASTDFEALNKQVSDHLAAMGKTDKKSKDGGAAGGGDKRPKGLDKREIEATAVNWERIAANGRSFSKNISQTTLSLAKWTGLTATFSGILGAGGLFGIERFAASTARERSKSLGHGVSYGEQAAFETNFSRLGDPNGMLDWMSDMLNNPEDRWPLYGVAGAGKANKLMGMDAASASAEFLPDIKRKVDSFPAMNLDQMSQAFGIPVGLARVLRNMSSQELQELIANYRRNAAPMNLSPDVLRKWSDLNATLEQAEAKVSTAFINQLSNLTPGVEKFAKAGTHLIEGVLRKGGVVDGWMHSIAYGLDGFANKVESRGFQSEIDKFVKQSNEVAKAIREMGNLTPGQILAKIGSNAWEAVKNYPAEGMSEGIARGVGNVINRMVDDASGATTMVHGPTGVIESPYGRTEYPDYDPKASQPSQPSTSSPPASPVYPPLAGGSGVDLRKWQAGRKNVSTQGDGAGEQYQRAVSDRMAPAGSAPISEGTTVITSKGGARFRVATEFAPNFKGFIDDYEDAGGVIGSAHGGLGARPGNASYHPLARAIDLNQIGRDVRGGGVTLPNDVEDELAHKWGLRSGSEFSHPDRGHFEVNNAERARNVIRRMHGLPEKSEAEGPAPVEKRTMFNYQEPSAPKFSAPSPPSPPPSLYMGPNPKDEHWARERANQNVEIVNGVSGVNVVQGH